jgi:spoIIIJ-associated protein
MRTVEMSGKTVEEATHKALEELGVLAEHALVEIITESSPGLFGIIGSKQARIRVTEKINPEHYLRVFLQKVIDHMGVEGQVETVVTDEALHFNINGQRMGMLIGKRGQTLNALQYLLNVAYHKKFPGESRRVIVDVEDYREKRELTLQNLAVNLAQKATHYQKEVVLEPMNPQERRIIHTTLQENSSVDTYSQGEEPYRKVVIAPK